MKHFFLLSLLLIVASTGFWGCTPKADTPLFSDAEWQEYYKQKEQNAPKRAAAEKQAAEERERKKKEQEQEEQIHRNIFTKRLAELDARRAPELTGIASAIESVTFISEKIHQDGIRGGAPQNFDEDDPCRFLLKLGSLQRFSAVDLAKLNLSILDNIESTKFQSAAGTTPILYRIHLKDTDGHALDVDFNNPDTAQRVAKAFVHLSVRCGNKIDKRFR